MIDDERLSRFRVQWHGSRERNPGQAPCGLSRRVLVVDDSVDAADTLAEFLRMMGHEVRVAYDGPTALEMAQSYCPEVVLLDIGLLGMDGIEVGRRLRSEHSRDSLLMLAALTGYGSEEDRRQCAENGFDVHLTKPIDPAIILEVLAEGCPAVK